MRTLEGRALRWWRAVGRGIVARLVQCRRVLRFGDAVTGVDRRKTGDGRRLAVITLGRGCALRHLRASAEAVAASRLRWANVGGGNGRGAVLVLVILADQEPDAEADETESRDTANNTARNSTHRGRRSRIRLGI